MTDPRPPRYLKPMNKLMTVPGRKFEALAGRLTVFRFDALTA